MRRFLLMLLVTLAFAGMAAAEEPVDINQPASPAKPLPQGMKFADQEKLNPRLQGYILPEGFKLDIVAEEPLVINPVGMTFGPDGTLFVLEWVTEQGGSAETPEKFTYKDGTSRTVATMKKKVKDHVKALTWNAAKGVFDQARVILEDELPSSILIHDGYLYTSGRGAVRRWKLAEIIDGKNVAAKPEVIGQGFCGFHHHQVSGLTIGNDGWLYITSGDDDNFVEGSDGSRATVLRSGAVFRCRPDGSKMQVFSLGYRNPYRDVVFDEVGNIFHVDNDNEDGSKFTGCRLMHVAEESDFGWRLFTGARCCKPDPVRGAVYGELPGKMPPMLKTGRGSPAGLMIYNDSQFPDFYRGWLYYPDVFRKSIRAYKVASSGSTFKVTHEFKFLESQDPLFRPCQMITGPDGGIWICDWRTDSGGAGRLSGDGKHGRIYRVAWNGGIAPGAADETPAIAPRPFDSWAKAVQGTDEELIASLGSSDFTTRRAVQQELVRRGPKNREALLKAMADPEQRLPARAAAMGTLYSFWNDDVRGAFAVLLHDKESDIRRLAASGLASNCLPGDRAVREALIKSLSDTDPAVRRAVALALGQINPEGAADMLANAYKFDDGRDAYLSDAYLRALERCGKKGIDAVIGLGKAGDNADRDLAVAAFLSFRSRAASEAIPELLGNPHLSVEQRVAVIKSYTNYLLDPPVSLDGLIEQMAGQAKQPLVVQTAVIETLAETGNLKGAKAVNLLTGLLDVESSEGRMSAIRAIETARLADASPRLVQALGDKSRSAEERAALVKALRVLNDKNATAALKEVFDAPEPVFLRVEALRSLSVLDPAAAQPIAAKLLEQPDSSLQSEAVQVLGTRPEGAKIAAQRLLDKKLPAELLPQVSEGLRKHAAGNPELSKLLTEVMKGGLLLSLEPGQVEKIRQMVLSKGDPRRGKIIYLNSKALNCVNCHKLEGLGGQVGPDLTRLWETASLEKIMESIIEPSKEIKEGFQSFRLTTKSGQTYTGLKTVDKPGEVVIREATGKDVRIARDDIDELTPSKVSLMPDNVVSQLSFEQFIDLAAFLKNRQAQESLRGMVTDYWIVGPFGSELAKEFGPERRTGENEVFDSGDGRQLVWQRRFAEANGLLDLRAAFNKDRASAYAMTYVHSPRAQTAAMFVGADDTVRVWINGAKVHEQGTPRQAIPDNDRVRIDLKEGWNVVVVKVVNRTDAHGLFLRFEGEGLKSTTKKE